MVKHLKQFVGKLPTNCLSVFEHFVELALKGLIIMVRQRKNIYEKMHLEVKKRKAELAQPPRQKLPQALLITPQTEGYYSTP